MLDEETVVVVPLTKKSPSIESSFSTTIGPLTVVVVAALLITIDVAFVIPSSRTAPVSRVRFPADVLRFEAPAASSEIPPVPASTLTAVFPVLDPIVTVLCVALVPISIFPAAVFFPISIVLVEAQRAAQPQTKSWT